jgi:hypothetical protein
MLLPEIVVEGNNAPDEVTPHPTAYADPVQT